MELSLLAKSIFQIEGCKVRCEVALAKSNVANSRGLAANLKPVRDD